MNLPNHYRGRLTGVALAIAVAVAVTACGSSHPRTDAQALAPPTAPPSLRPVAAAPPATAITPAAAASPTAVPAGFEPASASFPSAASGFVLGAVGCQPQQEECTAQLVATTDGGARWGLLSTPDIPLFNPAGDMLTQASSVRSVVFASEQYGWLYGPGLWSTSDGGAHWTQVSLGAAIVPSLGGGVAAMAVAAGTAYAVISPDPFDGQPDQLFSSPVGQNAWTRVGSMTGSILAVSGQAAWFASGTDLWATADGAHWHELPFGCPQTYYGLVGIAAASPTQVVFLCAGDGAAGSVDKDVLSSSDGGMTVQLAGQAPFPGDPYAIAMPPGQDSIITLAAASGASFLDRSTDGGTTWAGASYNTGGQAWGSLSYVTPTVGWVVLGGPADGGSGQLLQTTDAGATWHPVGF
jgi:photosystem II stability/assembly factor-like uncharacterized protein